MRIFSVANCLAVRVFMFANASWRAGLPRVGVRSAPPPVAAVYLTNPVGSLWGRFAAQRGASPLATGYSLATAPTINSPPNQPAWTTPASSPRRATKNSHNRAKRPSPCTCSKASSSNACTCRKREVNWRRHTRRGYAGTPSSTSRCVTASAGW